MRNWYQVAAAEAVRQLESDAGQGLSNAEVAKRLEEHGSNELVESGGRSAWRILWEQLSGAMVLLLIVAAVVSLFLGEYKDAAVIAIIVLLNALLGFYQDYRAEKALAALKQLAVPTVNVRRGGAVEEIPARDLTPGDIVLLDAGKLVPADGRVLECANLCAQEAALTGESEAVEKSTDVLTDPELPIGDRKNMVFMGTQVAAGRGVFVVTDTGMRTELGNIAQMLHDVEREPTPLQRRLAGLGRRLALAALAIVALVFGLGMLRDEDPQQMFLTAMSMAVAAVPEGLPAVATVALAIGARRMLQRQALIRKLPAVETLGSVTVICSDKTGTLTENRMTVTVVDLAGDRIELSEELKHGGQPVLDIGEREPIELLRDRPTLALLMMAGDLCNDAVLKARLDNKQLETLGDPTEGAIVVAAARMGLNKETLEREYPRVSEVPFDSDRKRMTTVHGLPTNAESDPLGLQIFGDEMHSVAFSKGAVDSLLEVSDRVWVDGQVLPLDESMRQRVEDAQDELAARGMRVLGVAFHPIPELPGDADPDRAERELVFIGMIGMIDPPRAEVKEAVARCRSAGIRPIMITGDHPLTARHIAQQLGICDEHEGVLTGTQLERMSEAELSQVVESNSVYARVSPEHKLQIVRALQQHGQIVSMTGDGVNDAPALKRADIGVAMGVTGTDVAKESSEMVLMDDNFATIVNAVEQGRIAYDNIRKFIKYTLTSNAGEIWVMLLGPFLGMPLPLLPLQILWINLVTDGLPGLALALEPAENDTMKRPPHPPNESIFGRGMARDILWIGLLMGGLSLFAGYGFWDPDSADHTYWRTIVFTVLTLSQMGNAMATRSDHDSLFRIGVFSNKAMLGSVLLTFALQLMVLYTPFFQDLLDTTALSARDLGLCILLSTVVFWTVEAAKWLGRSTRARRELEA